MPTSFRLWVDPLAAMAIYSLGDFRSINGGDAVD
jgi:hypothetical protein